MPRAMPSGLAAGRSAPETAQEGRERALAAALNQPSGPFASGPFATSTLMYSTMCPFSLKLLKFSSGEQLETFEEGLRDMGFDLPCPMWCACSSALPEPVTCLSAR